MKIKVVAGILTLVFSAALLPGMPGTASAASLLQPLPAPAPENNQAWLEHQVYHKLVMLPWYSVFDNLEYRVDGGKVTLYGQAVLPILKSDAASSVKSIEGVREVDNQIQVLPLSPFDNQVRRAEYRAIFSSPQLSRYSMGSIPSIHIIVDNGHVTLDGVVSSQADKDFAGLRANQVPDVFSVTNNLRVQG